MWGASRARSREPQAPVGASVPGGVPRADVDGIGLDRRLGRIRVRRLPGLDAAAQHLRLIVLRQLLEPRELLARQVGLAELEVGLAEILARRGIVGLERETAAVGRQRGGI